VSATFEVIAYRPTGAVIRAAIVEFGNIEAAIARLRYEVRTTHGFTPAIRVWRHVPPTTQDITHWYAP